MEWHDALILSVVLANNGALDLLMEKPLSAIISMLISACFAVWAAVLIWQVHF